jgi:dolichol kinase
MIPNLALALIPVGVILILSEFLWQKKIIIGERARKFIHILAGTWMAFWPLYLPFDGIFILSCIALTLLIYSRITKLFHAIYSVDRKTYGDIFFAVGILVCAYLGQESWIFIISILLLALADGGAAVIGRFYGLKNQYLVFGNKNLKKSFAGTIAFLVFSYVSIAIGWILGGGDIITNNIYVVLITLPIVSAVLENTMPYGLDNLTTPLFATLLLNSLL